MQFLTFIVPTIIQLYIIILLLRVWMQWVRADFYNPFSQFVVKVTQPIVGPLRRLIPAVGAIDTATLLVAYILTVANILFFMWATNTLALISITLLPISFIQLLTYVGKLIFWLILIRAILSWISQGRNPIDYMLMQLTEPLMSPIRRIIPAMGGLDFSAMIVMLILIALNYLRLDILLFIDPTITSILFQLAI
ncbi:YggT family protein [Arsenophonus nasoniae]|uniref:YGGT family protein n=1 Tax=Arsenophonus nasoniae TaxID=638 RepID=D2U077_9GAMM|nr:YggT family protein [Arsenophonus nasoniae]QBY42395.1 YGGT family protein [Arsenophonus nasoniae]WGL94739.1 YggT family protein [Arsenophonus nasoniae]WGM02333.1 YggT family protein [Arsenophonus nasoniae]WGM06520.1 YggT family protein [Arsenophonus nasoniae]WGM11457.1 YggT family protein [Arsenophonus nasoniae]